MTLATVTSDAPGLDRWSDADAERAFAMLRRAVGLDAERRAGQGLRNNYYCRNGSRDARLWRRLAALGFAARFASIVPEIDLWCVTTSGAVELLELSRSHAAALGRLIPATPAKDGKDGGE